MRRRLSRRAPARRRSARLARRASARAFEADHRAQRVHALAPQRELAAARQAGLHQLRHRCGRAARSRSPATFGRGCRSTRARRAPSPAGLRVARTRHAAVRASMADAAATGAGVVATRCRRRRRCSARAAPRQRDREHQRGGESRASTGQRAAWRASQARRDPRASCPHPDVPAAMRRRLRSSRAAHGVAGGGVRHGSVSVYCEQHAQAAGAARELRFGKARRALHQRGDLLVGIALGVVQPQHAAGRGGQAASARCSTAASAAAGGSGPWSSANVVVDRDLVRELAVAAQAHQRLVDRDLAQPAPERTAAAAEFADPAAAPSASSPATRPALPRGRRRCAAPA